MIVKIETLTLMDEFKGVSVDLLKMKLEAIENLIRSHTNNNFQMRNVRFTAASFGLKVYGVSPYLKVGDTVQISESINDGLYVVNAIDTEFTTLDKDLFDYPSNLITKVYYPPDVQKGVIDLMIWEQENRQKVGIKSETISRHSVTYYDQDANNQVLGYPVSLLGFLRPYMKARF